MRISSWEVFKHISLRIILSSIVIFYIPKFAREYTVQVKTWRRNILTQTS